LIDRTRINGTQDPPPNSRDELENPSSAAGASTDFGEQLQPSENLMASLLAPLQPSALPGAARPEMFLTERQQSTFEESDFESLKSDPPPEKDSLSEM
jgi:hypothetical protein